MAAPLNRICHQAARNVSQCSKHARTRRSFANSTQWTPSIQQRRLLSQTSRSQATLEPEEATEEDFAAASDGTPDFTLPSLSDISSTGYAELEQHREIRELVRIAAWEMPLLRAHAQKFVPPKAEEMPLRWRYTTHFDEAHPASRKVVVMFKVSDLKQLDQKQKEKFRKLVGARLNPETDVVRMSCDNFEEAGMNKQYLTATIKKLVKECKDPRKDTFEDVPLDTRHHKKKLVLRFPEEWKITGEKKEALEQKRQALMLEEGEAAEQQQVVSGIAAIEAARQLNLQKEEQPIMAEARQPLPKGKQGRKEMGQTRGANRF